MEEPIKRSDAVEKEYTQAVIYGIVGLVALLLTWLFWRYGGMFHSFSWGFGLIWLGAWAYAGWSLYKTRDIPAYPVSCPYCQKENVFTAPLQSDFTCDHCLRRVPVENGRVLEVIAVRCPHCGATEQVSSKATVAICEHCQREFSVVGVGRTQPSMPLPQDDPTPYELVLLGVDRLKEEQAIAHLESFLTLTRPDVKKLLQSVPVVILTNLPRRKAEMLVKDLQQWGIHTEMRAIEDPNRVPTPW
ncbi:hypothetical protein HRbin15_01269 [bacterium HR15]|nr:hypothetical protein HRbin15_01269 [bacterium HR15]